MTDPVPRMDPRIDRLRGLLAIGVLVGHAIDLAQASVPNASGTLFSIAMATRPFYGFICVLGFIVLSGYCIVRSTMKRFSLPQYAVKRVTRVYPLLIVAVLLTALVEWLAFDSPYRPGMWVLGRDVRKFVVALAGFSGFKGVFGALAPAYTVSFELAGFTRVVRAARRGKESTTTGRSSHTGHRPARSGSSDDSRWRRVSRATRTWACRLHRPRDRSDHPRHADLDRGQPQDARCLCRRVDTGRREHHHGLRRVCLWRSRSLRARPSARRRPSRSEPHGAGRRPSHRHRERRPARKRGARQ